jgi:hypothetical protein
MVVTTPSGSTIQMRPAVVAKDVKVAGGVDPYLCRLERHLGCQAAFARVASGLAVPDDGRDHPVQADAPDAVVARVGEGDSPFRVHGDPHGVVEACLGRGTAVAGEPLLAGPRDRRDDPLGVDPADPVVLVIGEVHVTDV